MLIRPSAAIRQNYNEIAELCRQTEEPVFLTKNGEGDMVVLQPYEYHPNTSELVRLLKKGHHNVKLTDKEWKTLYNWIDFNAGVVAEGEDLDTVGKRLFDEVVAVASGKEVKSEIAGFHDMAIFKQGVTL